MAPKPPAIPASMVLTATDPMRRLPLPDAPSVEPGLNPNQPKARMKQPVRTITMSWPMIAFGLPSRVYLPMRGPTMMRQRQRGQSSHRVHHAGAGEIRIAVAQSEVACRGWPASRRPRPSWRTADR